MRWLTAICICFWFGIFSHDSFGQEVPALPNAPHIVVVGTGSAEAEADSLELTIGVTIARPSGVEARAAVEERLVNVVNSLLKVGIDSEGIVVNELLLDISYDYDQNPPVPTLAEATRTVSVTLRDITKFDIVTRAAIEGGATHIDRPLLRSNQEDSLATQAQSRAIRQASERAEVLANGFGRRLGSVYSVATSEARNWRRWSGGGGLFGAPGADPERIESLSFNPRPVERRTSVYVVYLLGPPLNDE